MAMMRSGTGQSDAVGNTGQHGVAQMVLAMAELMVVLDATVLSVMLVHPDARPEGVKDVISELTSN
jgi:hypothetical protein